MATRASLVGVLVLLAGTLSFDRGAMAAKGPAPATRPTGELAGLVVDAQGKAAAGCHVTVIKAASQDRTAVALGSTDKQGRFYFKDIPGGDYMVVVRTTDTKTHASRTIMVSEGQLANVGKLVLRSRPRS